MGLEELEKKLLEDAKKEANSILEKARAEKEKIIQSALERKKNIIAQAKKMATELAERERQERLSAAHLAAKQTVDRKRHEEVEKWVGSVWEEMVAFSGRKEYEKLLKKLINEGEKEIGKQSIVFVNKSDQHMAKKITKNLGKKTVSVSGGAIVATMDEKIVVNNSFEALFEQQKDFLRKEVFKELFFEGDAKK
ncbi:MAG: hypothetical protein HYW50_00320 [Candidatus Diapherotrites archaeon]|nr:hypothetical protein [Candidatus Diapherotrites archaeon]